jgi:hypothetical protein
MVKPSDDDCVPDHLPQNLSKAAASRARHLNNAQV